MKILIRFCLDIKIRNVIAKAVLKAAGILIILFVFINIINDNISSAKEVVNYFMSNSIKKLVKQEPYWLYDSGLSTFLMKIAAQTGLIVIAAKLVCWLARSCCWQYIKTAVPFLIGFSINLREAANSYIIVFAIAFAVTGALMLNCGDRPYIENTGEISPHDIIGRALIILHNTVLAVLSGELALRALYLLGNMFERENFTLLKAMLGFNFAVLIQSVMIIIAVFLSIALIKVSSKAYDKTALSYNEDMVKTGLYVFIAFMLYAYIKNVVPLLNACIPVKTLFYLVSPFYLIGAILLSVAAGVGRKEQINL